MPTPDTPPDAYRALALQTRCHAVNDASSVEEARARIDASIERIGRQIRASRAFIGQDCRLVVLPEYALTGHPIGEPFEAWIARACIEPDGKEEEALGAIAAAQDIHLAVNAYVTDAAFPALYFQACLLFGPSGDVLLRYRRLNSMYAPTPHDVWTRFLEVHGADAAFPVADTPLGRIAAIASEEILYPELVRALALRGAEVLVHPTSEAGSPRVTQKDVARRARAQENLLWVVSANSAGIEGSPIPGASTDGGSQIVDPTGAVVVEAGPGESMVAHARLDVAAQRAERRRPGMGNLLARQRFEVVADTYAGVVHPADSLGDGSEAVGREHFRRTQEQVIARLADAGII